MPPSELLDCIVDQDLQASQCFWGTYMFTSPPDPGGGKDETHHDAENRTTHRQRWFRPRLRLRPRVARRCLHFGLTASTQDVPSVPRPQTCSASVLRSAQQRWIASYGATDADPEGTADVHGVFVEIFSRGEGYRGDLAAGVGGGGPFLKS
ncbi:hypothetical protein C8R44DRAFT_745969 [Mycena epipterygia]|nr:hypothetical protein C8R44DRAFT_745969 [Mycena epipterygia]